MVIPGKPDRLHQTTALKEGLLAMENPRRVLVVDDELGIREGCRRALMPHGFEVEVAENGSVGLRKLREAPFDVVLIDAMLPGLSGLEVLQRARGISPDIICIVITGYAMVELAVQAIREGASEFIAKPFTPEQLVRVIGRELERRDLRRAAERLRALEVEAHELERARAELATLETAQSRFILELVHTLRVPLALLQTSLEVIRKGYMAPEEQPALLEQLERRAGESLATLDDLLLLAYLKDGVGLSRAEKVPVADALAAATAELEEVADRQGVTMTSEVRGQPCVRANRDHLKALWTQLLGNAIRYTPAGGRVAAVLWIDEGTGRAIGEVRDTGIGVTAEELPRIFEELYRGEAARAMQELGTGLGLPIVRQVVEMYGGTVEVESEVGRGSTFRFSLPASGHEE
jgi:signal transduction histidine kinase